MPALQPRPVHIKPIAAQRGPIDVEACVPASHQTTAQAAARVLEAASRNVSVTLAPADSTRGLSSLRFSGDAAVLRSAGGALDMAHIRAFHPCLRATSPGLDLVLVSPSSGPASAPADTPARAACPTALRSAERGAVEYAFRYAQRLQRRRVTVLSAPWDSASEAPAWHATLAAKFAGITLERLPLDVAMLRLAKGDHTLDVVVVPSGFFSTASAVAAGVSGAPELITRARISADALQFSVGNAVDDSDDVQATLEGLLLSAAQLLLHIGLASTALQVTNAVLKTLEDGLHSDGVKLLNPYTCRLDDDGLASAVIERLGSDPSRLRPACSAAAGEAALQPKPLLRVVSSA